MSHKKKIELHISGMTCGSCEVLIERKFKKIPGVKHAKVNQRTGKATIYCDQKPPIEEFQTALNDTQYHIIADDMPLQPHHLPSKNTLRDYLEIIAIVFLIFDVYLLLKPLHLFDSGLGITSNMSYGFIFMIGLVAAVSSCIAVTGGVLISLAAKYNEIYQPQTKFEKFKPHLYFNIGRIISYTILGGVLGAIGSVFTISARVTGIIAIAASLFMILMGMKILKLFPGLTRFSLTMPKFISHRILNLESKQSRSIPFVMGSLTFFLPCGFTQALQLYAISRGSFVDGALTMFFFSLGTLPALLSLSVVSSFAKGTFQKYFLKISGALVLILGIVNINNGFTLVGIKLPTFSTQNVAQAETGSSTSVPIVDGKQIVDMKVDGYDYTPSQFTVVKGVPVEWRVDGSAAAGCAQVITAPSIGITALLPKEGTKTINFTPTEVGDIPFSCSMGMTTRGAAFHVVDNTKSDATNVTQTQASSTNVSLDSLLNDTSNVQKVNLEISSAQGFYPPSHTVKKGIPVEMTVDDQIDLGGCMGTMTIPQYGVAQLLHIGKNVIRFTPTETGEVDVTCSMGILQHKFNVVD